MLEGFQLDPIRTQYSADHGIGQDGFDRQVGAHQASYGRPRAPLIHDTVGEHLELTLWQGRVTDQSQERLPGGNIGVKGMVKNIASIAAGPGPCSPSRPHERILVAARDLFRKHGIRGIGVDTIAEAAGTNKMTLYRHFGSKDELVCACLEDVARESIAVWDDLAAAHPGDPKAQLQQWVRDCAQCIDSDNRGCDLANAAVELTEPDHPARKLIEDVKKTFWNRLAQLCAEAGAAQPEVLADTLCTMFEGSRVSRQSAGAEGPSARFVRMGQAVIAAFGGA